MKWLSRFLPPLIRETLFGKPPRRPRPVIGRTGSLRPKYTGNGSRTRKEILRILADGKPQTRLMIEAQLDVKTTGIHLPRMEDEGLIVGEYLSRRKWYRLVEVAESPSAGEAPPVDAVPLSPDAEHKNDG